MTMSSHHCGYLYLCFGLTMSTTVQWAIAAGVPEIPDTPFGYMDYAVTDIPRHFQTNAPGPGGQSVVSRDNTPLDNPITDAGAALGRVLFYDRRLSHNNSTACASCHTQETGFADSRRLSVGFEGERTGRHSMALTNTKYYENGRMFWDERADTLEHQALMPIQDPVEMGMDLERLNTKLSNTTYYAELFSEAFGDAEITSERVADSLAQFVRSLVSYDSKFDSAFDIDGDANFPGTLTRAEGRGHQLFMGACAQCHQSNAQVANQPSNNGLDALSTDDGAGDGRFKVPSLRNVAVRGRFMHDGRFDSLEQVIRFYSNGVQDNPDLDRRLRTPDGLPRRLNLSDSQVADLTAFLHTLTDESFLTSEMFADPFGSPCDFDGSGSCDVVDINMLTLAGAIDAGVAVDADGNEVFDMDGSGVIDRTDLARWLDSAARENGFNQPYRFGDANLDGVVDSVDLNTVGLSWLTDGNTWSMGDFNGDGVVDTRDLNQVGVAWQSSILETGSAAAVPEPQACVALLVLMLFIARRQI